MKTINYCSTTYKPRWLPEKLLTLRGESESCDAGKAELLGPSSQVKSNLMVGSLSKILNGSKSYTKNKNYKLQIIDNAGLALCASASSQLFKNFFFTKSGKLESEAAFGSRYDFEATDLRRKKEGLKIFF